MKSKRIPTGSMILVTAFLATALHAQPQQLDVGTEATGALADGGTSRWAIQSAQGVGYELEVRGVPPTLDVSLQGLPGKPVNVGGKGQSETATFEGDGTLMIVEVVSVSGDGFYKIELTTRKSRAQLVREIIDEHLERAKLEEQYLYLAPDITQERLDNAARLHHFDKSKVLLMYDSSTGETGKAGFCLTDRKVYTRLGWAEDSYSLDYEDIKQVKREDSEHFRINEHMLVSTRWSGDPKRSAEVYSELLTSIRDEVLKLEPGSD